MFVLIFVLLLIYIPYSKQGGTNMEYQIENRYKDQTEEERQKALIQVAEELIKHQLNEEKNQ